MGKSNIHRGLRLALIPMLAGGDEIEQPPNKLLPALVVRNLQKHVTGKRQVISAQYKSLNIGLVQFAHCECHSIFVSMQGIPPIPGIPGLGSGRCVFKKIANAFCNSAGGLPWFFSMKSASAFCICKARKVCCTVLSFTSAK